MGDVRVATADVVVAAGDQVFSPGAVAFADGATQAVGPAPEVLSQHPSAERWDFPGRVIIPGLVNAHTHLCLTGLAGEAPYEGDFAAWLQHVLGATTDWDLERHQASLRDGISASLRAGTAVVGDVLNEWRAIGAYADQPLGGVVFLQVTGFNPVVAPVWLGHLAQVFNGRGDRQAPQVSLGICPHAPYSTAAELYREAYRFALEHDALLMTHLAETPEEEEFLHTGQGFYRRLLEERGTWVPTWAPPRVSPTQYLWQHGVLNDRFVYAHYNYPSEADIELMAGVGANVVYCPRSHAFFGHSRHPLAKLLARGVNVALGTDSLASNESLSVLAEMKLVRQLYPELPAETVFRLGTINGARMLRLADQYGALEPGGRASLNVVRVPGTPSQERVFEQVLEPEAEVETVVAWGERMA